MKKLLIVFHSKTGGARQMAEAAAKGAASEPEIQTNLIHASEAGPVELLESDAYIFATPENLAMMSGITTLFWIASSVVPTPRSSAPAATVKTPPGRFKESPPAGDSKRSPNRSSSAPMRKRRNQFSPPNKLANSISTAAKSSARP